LLDMLSILSNLCFLLEIAVCWNHWHWRQLYACYLWCTWCNAFSRW